MTTGGAYRMDYLRDAKRTCSRLGVGYAAFLLVGFLMQMEIGLVIGVLMNGELELDWNTWLVVLGSLSMYLFGSLICWLIIKDMDTPCRPQKQDFTAGQLVVAFLICMSIMYIGNIIGNMLMAVVNGIQGKPPMNPVNELVDNLDTGVLFLLVVMAAPLFEELLFRKLLIDRVAQYGDKAAIILSGVLFGLTHGNFYQFFYAFGLGSVFAYIYLNTGRLRYTIALHAIINFMGSIVALKAMNNNWYLAALGLFILTSMILGIVFLIKYRRQIYFWPGAAEIPKGKIFQTVFLNWGMILFFCISAALFLMS